MGDALKEGCGSEGKLQLTLRYTGLLRLMAVEIAMSRSSCASSKFCITNCTFEKHHTYAIIAWSDR